MPVVPTARVAPVGQMNVLRGARGLRWSLSEQRPWVPVLVCALILPGWLALTPVAGAQEPTGPQGATGAEPTVVIQRLEVSPSVILSEEEISAIRAKYEGRAVTGDELLAIENDFDALYAEKGYLAKALLPEQTLEDGVLRIQLVEARIGRLLLQGNQWTRDEYILARVGARQGDLVDLNRLGSALTFFNRTNDVKLHAHLSPGEEFGTSDVVVLVQEPARDQWHLVLVPPLVTEKRWSTSVTWRRSSLTGRRDPLSLKVVHGPGTWSGTAEYHVPVTLDGLRLGLVHHANWSDVLDKDGTPTPIQRRTDHTTLSLSQPWMLSDTLYSMTSLELQRREVELLVAEVPQSRLHGFAVTVGYTLEAHLPYRMWRMHHALRGGVVHVDGAPEPPEPDPYYRYNFSGETVWPAAPAAYWLVRGAFQYGFEPSMPDDERFTLGGPSTVRGIREAAAADQRGYAVSLEYRHTASHRLEIVGFVDHGRVWSASPSIPNSPSFTSMGADIRWRPWPNALITITLAVPLNKVEPDHREPVHVSVEFAW